MLCLFINLLTQSHGEPNIIGRVYYVRGIPPTFQDDFWQWIHHPLSLSGSHKYYGLTVALFAVAGFAVQLMIEGLLYHKRVQKREAIAAQAQAQRENNILRRQLQQRIQRNEELIAEREFFITQLQSYEQEQKKRRLFDQQLTHLENQLQASGQPSHTQGLKQTEEKLLSDIAQREETIAALQRQVDEQMRTASQDTQVIAALQERLSDIFKQQFLAKTQLEHTQTTIDKLKQQNSQKDRQIQASAEKLKQTEHTLLAEIAQREQTIATLQKQLQSQPASQNTQVSTALHQQLAQALQQQSIATSQLEQTQATIDELKQQNSQKDHQIQEMARVLEQRHQAAEISRQQEAEAAQQREELERSVAALKQEQKELRKTIEEIEALDLNPFERTIVNLLQSTPKFQSGQWIVATREDIQWDKGVRQFVDILLIGQSYVVVIEAKNYGGRIKAAGDPKLTQWFCYKPHSAKLLGSLVPLVIREANERSKLITVLENSQSL